MSIPKTSAGSGNIYLGSNLIAEGGCGKWKPGANTFAYYPLTSNVNDESGNGRNGTYNNVSFSSDGAYINANGGSRISFPTVSYENFTVSLWMKTSFSGSQNIRVFCDTSGDALYRVEPGQTNVTLKKTSTTRDQPVNASITNDTTWRNFIFTKSGNNYVIYEKGTQIGSGTATVSWNTWNSPFCGNLSGEWYPGGGYIKDYIIELKTWTAQEASNYYNQTKSEYGIS